MKKGKDMSILHETVARKSVTECEKFREYTNNLINKDYCYNDMQRYSNQLESAMKDFKFCLHDIISKKNRGIALNIAEINNKLSTQNSKIEQILEKYHTKLDGFKAARDEHREDFIRMFDKLSDENRNGDLLDEEFKYCSYITDEAFCELAIAKNHYGKTNAVILQNHYEIQNLIKELEGTVDGIVIEYKLCSVPLFFKELNSFI